MLLEHQEVALFFKLHQTLMFFVNQRLKAIDDNLASPEAFAALPPQVRIKVRDAFVTNVGLIDAFVVENPARLTEVELAIIRSWKHLIAGKFYLFRKLKNYTVFLSLAKPAVAYGVMGWSQSFEDLIGRHLPVLAQTVLLPFNEKIVYDGILSSYNISFGPGIRRSLNESFRMAKVSHGIVTSLPMSIMPIATKAPTTKRNPIPASKGDKDEVLQVVIRLIDQFCSEHLNEEYGAICRKLAETLARKRPSPLLQGRPNAWASGIVRAVGGVNFLHDKSQSPYMRSTDIDSYLGSSPSSGAAKLAAIRKMLKMYPFDPKWALPSRLEDNPMLWMLNVNGFMMDIRQAPREAQEVAFEKGLIPYIPADRQQTE